jgi:hypothetical protein
LVIVDSITKLSIDTRGAVAIAASHGGVYPAFLAAAAGLRGVVLHDAGIGLDEAGVAGLAYLERLGRPAAAVAHTSARIGDGADVACRGVVSRVNASAAALGCRPGQAAGDCARQLATAPDPASAPPAYSETRFTLRAEPGRLPVIGLDSISLAKQEDETSVIISGSHGGLLGGDPASALRISAVAAIYNDAGVGVDGAGIGRLEALEHRGIPAATVDAFTARIGSARSTWESGIISHVNGTAAALGCRAGHTCSELVATVSDRYRQRPNRT